MIIMPSKFRNTFNFPGRWGGVHWRGGKLSLQSWKRLEVKAYWRGRGYHITCSSQWGELIWEICCGEKKKEFLTSQDSAALAGSLQIWSEEKPRNIEITHEERHGWNTFCVTMAMKMTGSNRWVRTSELWSLHFHIYWDSEKKIFNQFVACSDLMIYIWIQEWKNVAKYFYFWSYFLLLFLMIEDRKK